MSVIAKRYVKAVKEEFSVELLEDLDTVLSTLSENFSDGRFKTILTSNLTSNSDKESILLASLQSADEKIQNFLKLLVKNGRLSELPAISKEVKALISAQKGRFSGEVLSSDSISVENVKAIADGLSKKLGKEIVLVSKKSEVSGVKVVVDELHIEIAISKNRIETDMINHILKAI
jgi:F-type H+-transporting ATPase subunit delta